MSKDFKKCAVITSYKLDPIKIEERKYLIHEQMLKTHGFEDNPDEFEKVIRKKFEKEPFNMRLLIVVDKLLTGFDAPSATYLYIDKKMQDHSLFQAVCRVNRIDTEDKEYGYIVDYRNLFKKI